MSHNRGILAARRVNGKPVPRSSESPTDFVSGNPWEMILKSRCADSVADRLLAAIGIPVKHPMEIDWVHYGPNLVKPVTYREAR